MRYQPIDLGGITPTEFAKLAGVTFSMVMKAKRGAARFSTDNALAIEARTGGRITRSMLRGDIWPGHVSSSTSDAA